MMNVEYVRYDDTIEVKQPNEDGLIDQIVASIARVNHRVFDKHRHALRDAHAKSHGVLRGDLSVYDGLPTPLQQGVFRVPRIYPIIVRFSTGPGDIRHDRMPAVRGMAIKLIGVAGQQVLPGRDRHTTQDFLLTNMPVLPFGDVAAYWRMQQTLERRTDDPDIVRRLLAPLAKQANRVLLRLGRASPTFAALSIPNTHILGETFYSMAAHRYGAYVAKVSAAPLSANVRQLVGRPIDTRNPSALRDLVVDFFRREHAEYELRVQLCTDLGRMPVEDAAIEWSETQSPYRAVARITLPPQDTYSPARRIYADDVLEFNPWHCTVEHRPLGSINRARRTAYEASARFRHAMNAQPRIEPDDIKALPD